MIRKCYDKKNIESKEEQKILLMKMKKESEKVV